MNDLAAHVGSGSSPDDSRVAEAGGECVVSPTLQTNQEALRMSPQQHQIDSNGVSLFAVSWGDAGNPPVVLVHGYPDNHRIWHQVAEQLATCFYVIAYDVRGAGQSDIPQKVSDYKMPLLAADLQAVVDALIPGRRFHLAGHDWGSIQSWESVTTRPLKQRILSFTTLSGPCLDHVGYWMRKRLISLSPKDQTQALRQTLASWYIWLFQFPLVAPTGWRLGIGKLWPLYLQKREGIPEPEENPTQAADGRYGVNLYRANFRDKLLKPQARHALCPVQLIVLTRDNYVGSQLFDDLTEWVPELYRRELDAHHWVPLSDPQMIAQWIGDFAEAVESGNQAKQLADYRVMPSMNDDVLSRYQEEQA